VRQREVGLRFHESFSGWSPNQTYNIRFKLNRLTLQRQHMAMDTAFSQDRVLFPERVHLLSLRLAEPPIKSIDPLIQQNPLQLKAATAIVNSPPGSVPFIIFGPCVLLCLMRLRAILHVIMRQTGYGEDHYDRRGHQANIEKESKRQSIGMRTKQLCGGYLYLAAQRCSQP
jgi:hypothetical protein